MKDGKDIIATNKLCWKYGEAAVLNDISLTIKKNRLYGIIGPNASGKTTLLKNLSRSLMPQKGSVFLFDDDITGFSNNKLARKVSCVPQNTYLRFEFSVMDMVLMGRSPYLRKFQSESEYDIEIAKNAMLITNTWHLREKNIGQISGGERQRVIIARALAQQTEIMLLDEPVSQLDIHHQIEILDIIKKLTEDEKLTAVLSLHDLNLAAQYSDFLILMDKGRIFKHGLPNEIITEENIQKVYGIKTFIMENPFNRKPHIIPLEKSYDGNVAD